MAFLNELRCLLKDLLLKQGLVTLDLICMKMSINYPGTAVLSNCAWSLAYMSEKQNTFYWSCLL